MLFRSVTVKNIKADINADGQSFLTPDFDGTMTVATLTATAQVQLSVDPSTHTLVATVGTVNVAMSNPSISISGIIGLLISPLINLLVPIFKGDIESTFSSTLKDVIGPLVADALNGLALSFDFDLPSFDPTADPVAVQVVTDFQAVDFTPAGGALILRGGAYTSPVVTPYTNLGSVIRGNCGAPGFKLTPPKAAPLELLLSDDLINEILYSAWRGGFLEFDVPPELLAGVDVSQFGIGKLDVSVSAMLAPVVSDCATGTSTVHIGDLKINAALDLFGQQMDVVMHVSLTTEIVFSAADGELSFGLAAIESIDSDIAVLQEHLVASEGAVADLVNQNLIPALIGGLGGGALGSFPLPELDVSGVKIAIEPTSVSRGPGQTVVSGNLK